MKRLTFLTVCAVVSLLCSCEKYVIPKPEVPTDVSYSADVQPIFDAKCVSCHKGSRDPNLNPDESYNSLIDGGYINTDNPESSSLYTTMIGSSHSSRSTEEQKVTILAWIQGGALDN